MSALSSRHALTRTLACKIMAASPTFTPTLCDRDHLFAIINSIVNVVVIIVIIIFVFTLVIATASIARRNYECRSGTGRAKQTASLLLEFISLLSVCDRWWQPNTVDDQLQ